MVSLGLMGTVWGLIMIGYLPDLENLELTGLIGALRTALFSTLVALIWVYIVVLRIIRPAVRLYARKTFKQSPSQISVAALQRSVEAFAANIEALNGAMAVSIKTMEEFKSRLDAARWEQAEKLVATSFETLQGIRQSGEQRLELMQEILRLSGERSLVEDRMVACLKALADMQFKQSETLSSIDDYITKKDARTEKDRKLLGGIVDVFAKYGKQ
jgi:hypothetical protein